MEGNWSSDVEVAQVAHPVELSSLVGWKVSEYNEVPTALGSSHFWAWLQ
jgi:hypothetical protein